jgi:Carboxypeptidase regulatory-like domain
LTFQVKQLTFQLKQSAISFKQLSITLEKSSLSPKILLLQLNQRLKTAHLCSLTWWFLPQKLKKEGESKMNAQSEAKLTMYQSVEDHCDDNSDIISANIAFQTAFTNFKTKVATIVNTAQQADLALTGFAAGKKTTKQELCGMTADIAAIIYAFADATGNDELKGEVNYSLTDLLRLKDSLLAPRCQNIHDKGFENKEALKDYGITAAILTTLQTVIDTYTETIPKPRTAVSSRKTLNSNLKQFFKETDAILENQMDKLVVTFKTTNPDFVKTYFSVRQIISPATTTTQLKGIITNKSDQTPIKDATVTIVELETTQKTKSSGEYLFKPIPNGTYTIRVTKEGFQTFEKDEIKVKLGQIRHLDVELTGS